MHQQKRLIQMKAQKVVFLLIYVGAGAILATKCKTFTTVIMSHLQKNVNITVDFCELNIF